MDNTAYCTLVKKYKRKDEKYNIKLCIYFNGERHYFQTEFDLTEDEWVKLKTPNLKEKKLIEIRDSLSEIENTARKVLKKTDYHNFDSFEESYYNEIHKIKKDSDFLCWFDAYEKYLVERKRPASYSIHVITSKNSLKSFKSKIKFHHVTVDFLERYTAWMRSKKVEQPTIESYLRDVRTVFNYAIKQKAVSQDLYPFGRNGYTIGTTTARKSSLSKDQMTSLRNMVLPKGSKKEWARDIFVFQYFTNGLNFVDLCKLKEQDLEKTDKGTFVNFKRTKTQETKNHTVTIRVILTPEAIDVIDRWGNQNREKDDYIFPYFNLLKGQEDDPKLLRETVLTLTRQINRRLKAIGSKLNIHFNLTTGIARHSFATRLKEGGVPIADIRDRMGHTSTKTTELYIDSIGDERIKEISTLLY